MGTRTLVGHEAGSDKPLAVLFCSTTMIAFGRVIHGDEDDMQAFLDWYEPQWGAPRRADVATLVERQGEWLTAYQANAEKRARSRYLDALAESEME